MTIGWQYKNISLFYHYTMSNARASVNTKDDDKRQQIELLFSDQKLYLSYTSYFNLLHNNHVYFYRFWHKHQHNLVSSPDQSTKPGDLLFDGQEYFLNLWEEIARIEQWVESMVINPYQSIKSFCKFETLAMIERMVSERYTSYNKVMPLFFWSDINLTLHYKTTSKVQKSPQQLLLFPSMFGLQHYLSTQSEYPKSLILSWSSTSLQKAKAYRSISNNSSTTLLCTHSQVFQNRNNLTNIYIFDPHSSYYHTFQDPRYRVDTVIEHMREVYKIA